MLSPQEYLASLTVKRTVRVPPYPEVAMRIQQLLSSSHFSLAAIARLVSSDAALAIRVLGLANSSAYRPMSGALQSVDAAVGRLGASQVAQSALSAALADGSCQEGPLIHFRFIAWRRSLTAAFLTQELAAMRSGKPGEAFLCGLLRDYGTSVGYANLETAIQRGLIQGDLAPAVYKDAVEGLQRELGRAVAAKWQLPERYRAALEDVDAPSAASDLPQMASQARRIATFIDTYPCVTDRLLVAVLPRPDERSKILRFIPRLPELLSPLGPSDSASSLHADAEPPSGTAPRCETPSRPSSNRAPGAQSSPSVRSTSFPAKIRRSTAAFEGEFSPDSEAGGFLVVPCLLAPGWIAEISLFEGAERLIFWVKVEEAHAIGKAYRLRVSAFGLDDDQGQRLRVLANRLRATG